jgi:hypothetical protein
MWLSAFSLLESSAHRPHEIVATTGDKGQSPPLETVERAPYSPGAKPEDHPSPGFKPEHIQSPGHWIDQPDIRNSILAIDSHFFYLVDPCRVGGSDFTCPIGSNRNPVGFCCEFQGEYRKNKQSAWLRVKKNMGVQKKHQRKISGQPSSGTGAHRSIW